MNRVDLWHSDDSARGQVGDSVSRVGENICKNLRRMFAQQRTNAIDFARRRGELGENAGLRHLAPGGMLKVEKQVV